MKIGVINTWPIALRIWKQSLQGLKTIAFQPDTPEQVYFPDLVLLLTVWSWGIRVEGKFLWKCSWKLCTGDQSLRYNKTSYNESTLQSILLRTRVPNLAHVLVLCELETFDKLTLTLQLSRAIDLEELKLLRLRVMECQRREEVNHPQRCRQEVEDYMKAFKKYRSEGEGPDQICCMVARDLRQYLLGEFCSLISPFTTRLSPWNL